MPRRRRTPETDDTDDDGDDGDGIDGDIKHPQRNAANARERARMRVLSKAFCRLKTTLPWVPADTKLSKLDTLRLATSYIAHLRAVLMDQPNNELDGHHKHPLTLTWPFSFQRNDSTTNETISTPTQEDIRREDGMQQWTDLQQIQTVVRDGRDVSYYY